MFVVWAGLGNQSESGSRTLNPMPNTATPGVSVAGCRRLAREAWALEQLTVSGVGREQGKIPTISMWDGGMLVPKPGPRRLAAA